MGVEEAAKKFLGEPFIWVCMAMVGVVLMGPTAANLARKAVGGDRNRGDVDQHGETITNEQPVAQAGTPEAGWDREALAFQQRLAMRNANEENAVQDRSPDSELTAADIRTELARRQQASREIAEDSEPPAPSEKRVGAKSGQQADSFNVERMVEEVRREMNQKPDASKKAVAGNGAKFDNSDSKPADTPAVNKPADREDGESKQAASSKPSDEPRGSSERVRDNANEPDSTSFDPLPDTTEPSPLPAPGDASRPETSYDKTDSMPLKDMQKEDRDEKLPPEDDDSLFSPWDEPLKFKADVETGDDRQDQATNNRRTPTRDAVASIPPESGGTWWDASVAQQFWPDRQAQFANIDSVVFVALQNSAQIQILNDQPRIEETFVQQREADFDWSAFVDASWNSIDEPVRSELQTGARSGRFVQEELHVGSGLRKRLDRGGQLQVGSTIGTVDNNSIFLAPPDQGTASFSLDYRQPLLRGRGREVTKSQIVLARLGVEASRHSVKQQMQRYLVEVVTAYWELYRARGVLSQRHRNFVRATEIVQRLSSRSSSSGASVQLQRAQAAASARHSEVIDAEYLVADAQERLMNLTHGDNLANSNQIEIIPTDAPPQFSLPHDLGSVTELAIRNRAEVKEVLAEIKAASVRQVVAIDGLKPQLDAIISSYVAGVRGSKDVGNAIYDQFSAGDPSYSVGMSFEIPIGRRSASAGMKRQEIQSRLLQNKLRKTLGDVSTSARSAFRDVYRLHAISENNRQVVAQSANALNAIQNQNGWLQKNDPSAALFLNDLLVSQDRLAAAEQNLLDSHAQLAIAYVTLKRATGELLQDNVCVEEAGCQTCGVADCGCSTVTQATWQQPIEKVQSILEDTGEQIDGIRDRFRRDPANSPAEEAFDVPLERHDPQPGVTPMPEGSDTAGEIFSAPRYPRSTWRATPKPSTHR